MFQSQRREREVERADAARPETRTFAIPMARASREVKVGQAPDSHARRHYDRTLLGVAPRASMPLPAPSLRAVTASRPPLTSAALVEHAAPKGAPKAVEAVSQLTMQADKKRERQIALLLVVGTLSAMAAIAVSAIPSTEVRAERAEQGPKSGADARGDLEAAGDAPSAFQAPALVPSVEPDLGLEATREEASSAAARPSSSHPTLDVEGTKATTPRAVSDEPARAPAVKRPLKRRALKPTRG